MAGEFNTRLSIPVSESFALRIKLAAIKESGKRGEPVSVAAAIREAAEDWMAKRK